MKRDLSRCSDLMLAKNTDLARMTVQSFLIDQGLKAEHSELKGNTIRQDPRYLQGIVCKTDRFSPKEDVLTQDHKDDLNFSRILFQHQDESPRCHQGTKGYVNHNKREGTQILSHLEDIPLRNRLRVENQASGGNYVRRFLRI